MRGREKGREGKERKEEKERWKTKEMGSRLGDPDNLPRTHDLVSLV